jgi:DNA-binding CsgD family transcriptional regulator
MKPPVLTQRLSDELHRNRRIVELIAAGNTIEETASLIFISEHTVKKRLEQIRNFYGVKSNTELVAKLHEIYP